MEEWIDFSIFEDSVNSSDTVKIFINEHDFMILNYDRSLIFFLKYCSVFPATFHNVVCHCVTLEY